MSENGMIRVVNYIVEEEDGSVRYNHRIEQCWDGHWVPVPVFLDTGSGVLQEIPQ